MGQALYRSYRSRAFDEVVGQDHVVKTLAAAIKAGRISHAYLFTGPRGVGKTSVARILAHAVNKLPYTAEGTHLDIIEIDAASNRRIDEIRDLRDKVHISPTSAEYKVYIIDEVHMLTREAFNALLKTLEEPPKHVIFILATTEAHKLPETIISRTQRFNFKPIAAKEAAQHLAVIAKKEKIKIDKGALELIARHGEGSFRDSISLMDQLASSGSEITVEAVRAQLGLPREEKINDLITAVRSGNAGKVLTELETIRQEAADASITAKSLALRLRQEISTGKYDATDLMMLKQLLDVPTKTQPDELLEIILLEATLARDGDNPTAEMPPEVNPTSAPTKKLKASVENHPVGQNFDLTMWEEVLEQVRKQAASTYTGLRLAIPKLENNELNLYFEFALHQKKLNQAQSKDTVCSVIEKICGDKVTINCLVDKELFKIKQENAIADFYKPAPSENIEAISNIFGSVEMLES